LDQAAAPNLPPAKSAAALASDTADSALSRSGGHSLEARDDSEVEIVFVVLEGATLRSSRLVLLALAQFDPANLARDGLRQFAELDSPDAFVRRKAAAQEDEDVTRQFAAGLVARA